MRILFLSGCAPAKYNYREPNAYPFYLIKEIASRHETAVLYFNANKKLDLADINSQLKDSGVVRSKMINTCWLLKKVFSLIYIPKAIILKLLIRLNVHPPKFIVPLQLSVHNKYPDSSFSRDVKEFAPDLVIVFPMQLYFAIKKLTKLNIPVTVLCTDSTALHYARQLHVIDRIPGSVHVTRQMLEQSIKLESAYKKIPARYLFVGKEDKVSFIKNSGQENNSFFIPHHLYSNIQVERKWESSDNRINVLFGGDGHTIYVGDETDRIAEQIAQSKILKPENVNFYFLGSLYDTAINILQKAGYNIISKEWAEDYDEYIKRIHVQVFPTINGTGTKAKVLAAMVSGLLCVGTWYAFENIFADKDDYLLYDSPADVPEILSRICNSKLQYEHMANKTREKILSQHNTPKVVDMILDIASR